MKPNSLPPSLLAVALSSGMGGELPAADQWSVEQANAWSTAQARDAVHQTQSGESIAVLFTCL